MSERSKPSTGGDCDKVDKYVLVACLEPIVVGDEFPKLPPHLTIFPPFVMETRRKTDFDRYFAEVAEENLPLYIHAHQPEYFGDNHDIAALPISGRFEAARIGAFVLARKMGLSFDDTYSFKLSNSRDQSMAMSFGSGDEAATCRDYSCVGWGQPHITDFEGVIEPGETRLLHDVQLFCYKSLKKAVSVYRRDMYDYVEN